MLTSASLRTTALLSLGLALTACSGGGGGGGTVVSETPTGSASSASAPAASASSAATADQAQVAAAFCSDRDDLNDLGTQIEAGGLPTAIERLPEFTQKIDAMQPPEAVAADFAAYSDAWHDVAGALAGKAVDSPGLETEVKAALAAHPDAEAVEDRLKAWADANCPTASGSPSAG